MQPPKTFTNLVPKLVALIAVQPAPLDFRKEIMSFFRFTLLFPPRNWVWNYVLSLAAFSKNENAFDFDAEEDVAESESQTCLTSRSDVIGVDEVKNLIKIPREPITS